MTSQQNRFYAALGVLFVVCIVAFFVNQDPGGKGAHRQDSIRRDAKPLPSVDQNRIAAIELSDSKTSIRLEKTADGWIIPSASRAPVMKLRLDELMKTLVGFERARHVAFVAQDDASYGLDPIKVQRMKLFDESGAPLIELSVGGDDMSGGKTGADMGCFVRPADSQSVYSHSKRLGANVRAGLSWWLDKALFAGEPKTKNQLIQTADRVVLEFADLPAPAPPTGTSPATDEPPPADPDDAPRVRVVLEATQETTTVETGGDAGPRPDGAPESRETKTETKKKWRVVEPEGADFDVFEGAVDGVIRTMLFGQCMDVVGADTSVAEYGLDRPSVSAEVRFADGTTLSLSIGRKASSPTDPAFAMMPSRYAKASGSTRVYRLNDYVAQQLRKQATDFKQPEIPMPIDVSPRPIEVPAEAPESKPVK